MFTKKEKSKVLKLKKTLDESIIKYNEVIEYHEIHTKKGFVSSGLCKMLNDNKHFDTGLIIKLHQLSIEYKDIFKIYNRSKLYWFPRDKNILKYRQDFINWVIENRFN